MLHRRAALFRAPERRGEVYRRLFRATIVIPKMTKTFSFSSLASADLVIDAVYEGGTKGNSADDVLGRLIPGAGNQGGFRQVGGWTAPKLVVLYSSVEDPDWPDFIDIYTGVFTFFGDNKRPGASCMKRSVTGTNCCSPASRFYITRLTSA